MTLEIKDVHDEGDCNPYTGDPFRHIMTYVCAMCDHMRCTWCIEVAENDESIGRRMSRELKVRDYMDDRVRMPCPLAKPAVFKAEWTEDDQ